MVGYHGSQGLLNFIRASGRSDFGLRAGDYLVQCISIAIVVHTTCTTMAMPIQFLVVHFLIIVLAETSL